MKVAKDVVSDYNSSNLDVMMLTILIADIILIVPTGEHITNIKMSIKYQFRGEGSL